MQIDYAVLGAFTLLWLTIVPTPGPNTLLIVHLALTAGWRDVGVALAGNLLAISFYALATLFGLALLLAAAPSVRLIIYVLGGAYLVWVGVRLVRAGLTRRRSDAGDTLNVRARRDGRPQSVPAGHPDGAVERAGAVLPRQHLRRRRHSGRQPATQIAAVGVIVAGNGGYLTLLAWLLQRERPRAFYARNRGAMEIGFGALFLAFGARLVLRELAGWL